MFVNSSFIKALSEMESVIVYQASMNGEKTKSENALANVPYLNA